MKRFLLLIAGLWLSINIASAVLPPDVYQRWIENSEIKAVAVVQKVETVSWKKGIKKNKVYFNLIKPLSKDVPDEFTGYCESFERKFPWDPKEPMLGGIIYRYPVKGQRVVVAVGADGGEINAYEEATPTLEAEMNKNGLKNIDLTVFGVRIRETE